MSRFAFRRSVLPAALLSVLSLSALAGCAGAPEQDPAPASADSAQYPVTVTSCGHDTTVRAQPTRVVTLNQGATEVVLALGLGDQLAGTAYLDDQVPERWRAAYEKVPVLSKEYPTNEQFLATDPDFAYASYGSAFEKKVVGTQAELDAQNISSYLSPFGCPDAAQRPDPSFDAAWDEVDAVATALGHPEKARALRTEQSTRLAAVRKTAPGAGRTALWWDGGTKTPFVGANSGGPHLVMDAVGLENIFDNLDGGWADGNWEDVLQADPEVIVLADASWDTARAKRQYLENDPVLKELTAVRNQAFVVLPFSESTPGIRLVDGAERIAAQLEALSR